MSSSTNGHGHGEHAHGNGLGDIGSQEAVTVVALAVTAGILGLMFLVWVLSRIL